MKRALFLASLMIATPAAAQIVSGPAVAIDGDTLEMTGTRVRLFGIDAVESAQTCTRSGAEWACGAEAKRVLGNLVNGRDVACQQRDIDVYGRIVAVCRAGGLDLAEALANGGLAVALTGTSEDYAGFAHRAKSFGLGIWGGAFAQPADYRAAHPRDFSPPVQRIAAPAPAARTTARLRPPSPAPRAAAGIWFASCAQARAAGFISIPRGQPGYRPILDADSDGFACEPLPRRR